MKRFHQVAALLFALAIAVALFSGIFALNPVVQAASNGGVVEEEGDVDVPITPTKTIRSISVKTKPAKLTYLLGEWLDTAGLVVRATYSDGSQSVVEGYQVSGFNPDVSGEQTIYVTLGNKTASFKVFVYSMGDANGDYVVDNNDVTALMQYVIGWDIAIQELPADVNGDGEINGDDATWLQRYIAGWDVTLG